MAVSLSSVDPASTPDAPGEREETEAATEEIRTQLVDLQERLWAEHRQSLLVVLQAMDAGGKDGTIRKVFSGVNPQGCRVHSFKQPSVEELDHDFLWRVHQRTPGQGDIVIFNRSHYEDVLVTRVLGLVSESVWRPRYRIIRDFEHGLAVAGTRIVKVMLHISRDEQAARLAARRDDPTKQWKYSARDLDMAARWGDFMAAYEEAINETSTDEAPWHVVPADKKWYRNWAVARLVVDALSEMDPRYPASNASGTNAT